MYKSEEIIFKAFLVAAVLFCGFGIAASIFGESPTYRVETPDGAVYTGLTHGFGTGVYTKEGKTYVFKGNYSFERETHAPDHTGR